MLGQLLEVLSGDGRFQQLYDLHRLLPLARPDRRLRRLHQRICLDEVVDGGVQLLQDEVEEEEEEEK